MGTTMPLTADDLSTFATRGMVVKRNFVPAHLIDRATALVTDWYRTDLNQRRLAEFTQRTFAPHLGDHKNLLALFSESGVAGLAGDLIGDLAPITTTQIQIRVPERELGQAQPEKAMHVDGVACPHLDPAELRTFSLLVGVVLSDISDPAGGALRYVVGGHLRMAEWFRTQWSLGITAQVPPHIDAEQGTPLLGKPGDVLLMHHLVPHAVGRNLTAIPRIMAYFRVSHVNHASRRLDALRDPWLDFPPLTAQAR
ncbi:phytanoyl-CoA dioxygenase family protein [Micromonospora peucetia]|uniref:phytanoyl-CoA dioxygenase family protein n=1 Tax=Micromonospora peucetia TaxID=47871 RepID=UPI00224F11CA|nr:phytanoyl-CoA dioxygenase family protein [Micromonospora peucetia]MCX4387358.1 phytanoyl-CoA dioxygenase family protein [Micromonospora peucetia]